MKKSKFIEIIKKLIEREKKIKEASTSANVPGYMTPNAFSGKLIVQGTMASTPSDSDYFTVTSATYTDASAASTLNFTGVYHNVRFSWDNDSGNTGKIDKILYRQ